MESPDSCNDWSAPQQRRARAEATIDQTLGDKGLGDAKPVKERYQPESGYDLLSVSYNNSWHGVSYSLSYSVNKTATTRTRTVNPSAMTNKSASSTCRFRLTAGCLTPANQPEQR